MEDGVKGGVGGDHPAWASTSRCRHGFAGGVAGHGFEKQEASAIGRFGLDFKRFRRHADEIFHFAIQNVGPQDAGGRIRDQFEVIFLVAEHDRRSVMGRDVLMMGRGLRGGDIGVFGAATGEAADGKRRQKNGA